MYTFRTKNNEKFGKMRNLLVFAFILSLFVLTTPFKSTAIYDLSADNPNTGYEVSYNSIRDPTSGSYFSSNAGPFPDNKPLRVAIYDEANTTHPTYAAGHGGFPNNNVTRITEILSMRDHITAVPLTTAQIDGNQLNTAYYDVLILIDNHPRESIVNDILEFWLAGGGVLAFDGSALFLNYFGVLPPEAIGTDGFGVYWNYVAGDMNITNRHPISKDYQLADEIPISYDYLKWDWTALQGSVIGPDLTMVANSPTDSNRVTALAFDPTDRGGKIVTIADDLAGIIHENLSSMVLDACDWLAPRAKAKIAFDYGHLPRRSIDPWDDFTIYSDSYVELRDHLVSIGYTVDKLYKPISSDTLTLPRLEPYDLLIVLSPDADFTANERTAVEIWVGDGGSILALGDNHLLTFIDPNLRTNQLLSPFDLAMYEADVGFSATLTNDLKQPMTSNCDSGFTVGYAGYVNYTGDAFPIWQHGPGPNFVAAGNEFGEGRVILISDINWCESGANLGTTDNYEVLRNSVEWLTAATAKVLVYVDWAAGASDFYRTQLPEALNDLGVTYYFTTPTVGNYYDQLNMSLTSQEWDLVVIDNANFYGIDEFYDELITYIESGGHLLISSFVTDNYAPDPIFPLMGFNVSQDVTNEPPVYIWDAGHDIFNQPVAYGADRFESGYPISDDGDRLEVYSNGIPLAGYTATETANEAFIVLRDDGQTLYNAYLIDEFTGDLDDSTYADSFELWKNEIAFMLRPKLEFTPNFDLKVKKGDALLADLDITNFGLSRARAGLVTLTLPAELGTTVDPVELPFSVAVSDTTTTSWSIDITGTGTYTLTFEALYQGFLGTVYGVFSISIDVKSGINFFSPPALWYLIGIGSGVIVLIIIIVIIAAVSKKKKVPTR